jgi:hypothetical protein
MSTKTKLAMPKITTKISPLESVFEVEISEAGTNPWFGETFKFSLSSDGTVVINDNSFSSKKQASQALKAMSDFLSK